MSLALIETGHCNVELKPSPIEPAWILDGNPEARSHVLSTSACGTTTTPIWPRRYRVGDAVLFRDGARVKWHVEGPVKKITFFRQTIPLGLSFAVRAINKLKRMVFVPGGRLSAPQQDPAAVYGSMGKSTLDAAPARFSWRRKTHAFFAALLLDDLNLAAIDGFLDLVQMT